MSRRTTGVRTSRITTVGVSGILFVATHDSLRTYVSPQVAYTPVSSTLHSGGPSIPDLEITSSGYSAGGLVGALYAIGRRFSAYGELGIAYRHSEGGISRFETSSTSTRLAIGVVLYC